MRLRVKEIIVIVLILAFIVANASQSHYIDTDVKTIVTAMESVTDLSEMDVFTDGMQLKKDFSLNENDYDGVVYYGHETIMNSEKILIIKVKNSSQGRVILEELIKLNDKTAKLFQAYAPDQYDLLKHAVLEQKGNYVLYVVSEQAKDLEATFTKCIKGKV